MSVRRAWPHALFLTVLVLGLALFTYKDRSNEDCHRCYSHRVTEQYRLGAWMGSSVALGSATTAVTPSHLIIDFPDPQHRHIWTFSQGSPYYLFGQIWGGCALGARPQMNALASTYENEPAFRVFVHTRLKGGLNRRDFFDACLLTEEDTQSPRSSQVQTFMDLEAALLAEYRQKAENRR